MTWRQAERLARAGTLVRAIHWPDRWLRHDGVGLFFLRIMDATRQIVETERVPLAADFGPDEFAAQWTTAPLLPDPDRPLETIDLQDVFSSAMVSFGEWPAGQYRVRYEQGALFYVAGNLTQLRINAYSTSNNGFRINSTGVVDAVNDTRAPGDSFRYPATETRSQRELLEEIRRRNAGATVDYTHPGGAIFMYLVDDFTNPTGANSAALIAPRFSLLAAS